MKVILSRPFKNIAPVTPKIPTHDHTRLMSQSATPATQNNALPATQPDRLRCELLRLDSLEASTPPPGPTKTKENPLLRIRETDFG